jgi:dCMP deaminase
MDDRPSWPLRMIALAEHWSQYSTCVRRQVGAVLFNPETKAVLSIGYNDTPLGQQDCGVGGCPACQEGTEARHRLDCRCVHAEGNSLAFAARYGLATEGTMIATTFQVCDSCRKMLVQAGVTGVVVPFENQDGFQSERF